MGVPASRSAEGPDRPARPPSDRMEVPDQNLGNGLGVLGGRPKPSSDGFVFVAGDFLGGTEAPPAHHNEQRASHFGGGSSQPIHRRSVCGAERAATLAANPARAAVFASVADDGSGPTGRAGWVIWRGFPSHLSPPPEIITQITTFKSDYPDARGRLQVARGGVFSYYEFLWPASDRLTDEQWRKILASGQAPERPAWTAAFVAP